MRPDKPKPQAPRKSGTQDENKGAEDRNPPKAASKPERDTDETTLAQLRDRPQKGPTIH